MNRSECELDGFKLRVFCRDLRKLEFDRGLGMYQDILVRMDDKSSSNRSDTERLRTGFFLSDNLNCSSHTRQVSVGEIISYELTFENYGEEVLNLDVLLYNKVGNETKRIDYFELGHSTAAPSEPSSPGGPLVVEPQQQNRIKFSHYIGVGGRHTIFCYLKARDRDLDAVRIELCSLEATLFLIIKADPPTKLSDQEYLFRLSILNVSQHVTLIRGLEFDFPECKVRTLSCNNDSQSVQEMDYSLSQNGKLQYVYTLTKLPGAGDHSSIKGIVKVVWSANSFFPVTLGVVNEHELYDKSSSLAELKVESEHLVKRDDNSSAPSIILQLCISNKSSRESLQDVVLKASIPRRSRLILPHYSREMLINTIGPNEDMRKRIEVIPMGSGILEDLKLALKYSSRGRKNDISTIIHHKIHY